MGSGTLFLLLLFGQVDVRQAVLIIFLHGTAAHNLVWDAPASCLKWQNPDWYRISACPVSNGHIRKINADTWVFFVKSRQQLWYKAGAAHWRKRNIQLAIIVRAHI